MVAFHPDVSPSFPESEQPVIGIIGMGAMGKMYAKHLSDAGWCKIHVCDRSENYDRVKQLFHGVRGVNVFRDGHGVSRSSDWVLYSVEAEFIEAVVAQFAPSTKIGAVVAGQTSVKAPEKLAFEKYLPSDVQIISCHSLHGPTISPLGQPLILIKHRGSDAALRLVENILRPLRSRYVYMTYDEHDLVTANTQAVTHAAFLSMGTAWFRNKYYPWEHGYYVGGIETVKVNIMLRIYSNSWHVYAGIAIMNPSARTQIDQFASSATELFKLMISGDENGLRQRIYRARSLVFGAPGVERRTPILLTEDILDQFSLGPPDSPSSARPNSMRPLSQAKNSPPNSHLSLLAMVDCWACLGIQPFDHLDLAATPIFRMWIGVAEYLFHSSERLDAAINAALFEFSYRQDDLEFVVAAREWSQCVSFGSFDLYRKRFSETRGFFETRFGDATQLGTQMIQAILDSTP